MLWTDDLAAYLELAPWPATKLELIDFAIRVDAPLELVVNLYELDDTDDLYLNIGEIWPEHPDYQGPFLGEEDEY